MSGQPKARSRNPFARVVERMFFDPVKQLLGDAPLASEVRGYQHQHVKSFTPLMLLVNFVCMLAVIPTVMDNSNLMVLGGWAMFLLSVIFIGAKGMRFKLKPSGTVRPRENTHSIVVNSIVLAIVWGLLPVLFFADATTEQKVFITSMVAGMMGGGTMTLASIPAAARAFCWTIAAFVAVTLLQQGGLASASTSVLLVAYAVALSRLSGAVGERFVQRYIDQNELEEQRSTIGMLLKDFEDSSSDWMWQTDAEGLIVSPSERFCESVGMSEFQLAGKPLKNLVSYNQPEGSGENKKRCLSEKLKTALVFREHQLMVETANGPRWWSLTGKPVVDDAGELVGFRGTASNIQEAKNTEEKLRRMALFDRVTGLRNRSHLQEALAEKAAQASDLKWAVVVIDLDGFKAVNTSLGHSFGDALLREAGSRLETCAKANDCVVRLSADQFCILIDHIETLSEATLVAQNAMDQLVRPFVIQGQTVSLKASVGVALSGEHNDDMEAVLRHADLAMVAAKNEGGGKFTVFEEGMDEAMNARRSLEIDLRKALKRKEFVLHYQAVTDAQTGGVCTFEALVRWNHPQKGLIMPDVFLPLAEETGLIIELGEWILQQACADAKKWAIPHRVAVNVSGKQVMSQRLLLQVIKTLDATHLPANRLELEVTESVLIENPEQTRTLFTELRRLGVTIALDDFGTGYSSLSYLVRFPFDKVKIDKSFIQEASQSQEAVSIVRSILGLADNLGIRTIAEGIENEEQMHFARQEGCHEMQGYLINAPKPLDEIPALSPKAMSSKTIAGQSDMEKQAG